MSPEKRKLAAQEVRAPESPLEEQLTESPYTLEEFSYQFFRCSPHSEGYRKSGLAGAQPEIEGGEGRLQTPCKAKQGQRKPQHRSSHQPSLPGLRRKRPSAGPRCPWPEAGAICGPTPQSHCASHYSNLSTTKPNCGMQPARSSSISFPLTYPNCRQACGHTYPGPLKVPQPPGRGHGPRERACAEPILSFLQRCLRLSKGPRNVRMG